VEFLLQALMKIVEIRERLKVSQEPWIDWMLTSVKPVHFSLLVKPLCLMHGRTKYDLCEPGRVRLQPMCSSKRAGHFCTFFCQLGIRNLKMCHHDVDLKFPFFRLSGYWDWSRLWQIPS